MKSVREVHIGTYWTRKLEIDKAEEQFNFSVSHGKPLAFKCSYNGGQNEELIAEFTVQQCKDILRTAKGHMFRRFMTGVQCWLEGDDAGAEKILEEIRWRKAEGNARIARGELPCSDIHGRYQ